MPLKGTAPKPVKPRARSLIDDEAEESSEEEEEDEEMEGGCRRTRAWGAGGSRGVGGRVNACEQAAAGCLPGAEQQALLQVASQRPVCWQHAARLAAHTAALLLPCR